MQRGFDYRAELARHNLLIYEVAAEVGIHPVRLSRMLREKEPLTGPVRQKLDMLLESIQDKQQRENDTISERRSQNV